MSERGLTMAQDGVAPAALREMMVLEPSAMTAELTDARSATLTCVERLARAAGDSARLCRTTARAARTLIGCDAAVLLRSVDGGRPAEAVVIDAPADCGAGEVHGSRASVCGPSPGTFAQAPRWELGARGTAAFEGSPRTLRDDEPDLQRVLSTVCRGAWAVAPVAVEAGSRAAPLLLAVCRCEDGHCPPRPIDESTLDRLDAMARTTAAALSRVPGDGRPDGGQITSAEAERAEHLRIIGGITFGVAHTLGNIFGGILGNLHFLAEESDEDRRRELLDRLQTLTDRGIDLTRAVQDFTPAPTPTRRGPMSCLQPVNLSEVAADAAGLAQAVCAPWESCEGAPIGTGGAGGLDLRFQLSDDLPAWGDGVQLRESLVSIIFNSVQATGGAGPITITGEDSGRFSQVHVRDDGPGMTDEVRRRATEPFFSTRPAPHEGLGLTIARGIAVAHGGGLQVTRASRGSEVVLRVPQHEPTDPAAHPSADARGALTQRSNAHVEPTPATV